jgi:hypothetical protein
MEQEIMHGSKVKLKHLAENWDFLKRPAASSENVGFDGRTEMA